METPIPLPKKEAEPPPSKNSAHVYCGQIAGWIKMALGMEVGLSPGDFVLDGDPAPPPKGGGAPLQFRPISIVAKRQDASRSMSLGMEVGLGSDNIVLDRDPAPF